MNLNRKRVLTGLAAAGITVGTLAGGGVAFASTGPAHAPAGTAAAHAACGHMHGKWGGHDTVLKAVAGYLGVSEDKLHSKLESGKSLADVAKEQDKSVSGLKETILTSVTTRINAAKWLNASQKSALITDVKSHLGAIVNATCSPSGSPSGSKSGSPSGWPSSSGSGWPSSSGSGSAGGS